jgi:hypothetical protein
MGYISTHLQIDCQARAILNALTDTEFPNVYIETFAFYNGRERWVGLKVQRKLGQASLIVIFGENRNSDAIALQHWVMRPSINPPTVADMPEESYKNRQFFSYLDLSGPVKEIRKLIEQA